jgi:hypothetical protein
LGTSLYTAFAAYHYTKLRSRSSKITSKADSADISEYFREILVGVCSLALLACIKLGFAGALDPILIGVYISVLLVPSLLAAIYAFYVYKAPK